jgi:hypothetical protein
MAFAKTNAKATPKYTGLQIQTSAEGVCIPIVWGRGRVGPNLINAWNFQTHAAKGKKGRGGKGGHGGKSGAQTTYSAGISLAICEGPIQDVGTVWQDQSTTSLASLGFTLYIGDQSQGPADSSGVAYRQTAYVTNPNYNLGAATTLSQHNFEVIGKFSGSISGTPDVDPADVIFDLLTNRQYGLGMPSEAVGDRSAYSSYCRSQGLLFSPVLSSQEQAITVLQRWAQVTNSWIFWSGTQLKFVPLGDSSISFNPSAPLGNSDIASAGNGYNFGDVVTVTGGSGDATLRIDSVNTDSTKGPIGAVHAYTVTNAGTGYGAATNVATTGGSGAGFTINIFVGGAASFTPNVTPVYSLTYEDFQTSGSEPPVKVTRSDPADGYNWVKIEISARDRDYNTSTIEYKDQTSIDQYGLLQAQDVQAKELCDRNAATVVAALLGKRAVYIRNTYAFRLSYNFVLLEPGDIVTLTEPAIGLDNFPVRIRQVDEDDKGTLSIVAEEFPASIGTPAIYPSQGWQGVAPPPYDADPGPVNPPAIIEPPASVTQGVAQVWVGLSGAGAYWGGAQVWVSIDDVTYVQLGQVTGASAQGVLIAPLPSHADPDTADTLQVDLSESHTLLSSSVTHADADAGRVVALVESELVGYGAVVPGTANSFAYNLTYLRRGVYSTPIAAHPAGAPFTAINPDVMLQVNLPQQYVGRTIYLKFPSFNIYGAGLEDISTVTRYTYTPIGVAYTIAPPSSPVLAITTPAGAAAISLGLSWSPSAGPNLGTYEVQFSIDGGASWTGPDAVVGASAVNYTLSPALANTNYQARVSAISANGAARSQWATSNVLNSGPAPVVVGTGGGGPSEQLLVNGDIPLGIITDQYGVPVYVVQ